MNKHNRLFSLSLKSLKQGKWLLILLPTLLAACTFTLPIPQLERHLQPRTGVFTEIECAKFNSVLDETFKCGYVSVAADHSRPEDTRETPIQLAVVIAEATAPDAFSDPIIMLSDRPAGANVTQASTFQMMMFGSVKPRQRAVIWIDPRGAGYSWPSLSCHNDLNSFVKSTLDTPPTDAQAYIEGYGEAMQHCFATWRDEGVDFANYTTMQNVGDVLTVIKTLGYNEFNIMAEGYGTRVTLELLHTPEAEGKVRSAVLASPYDASANPLEIPAHLDDSIHLLLEECASDVECQRAFPNLGQQYDDLLADLTATPVQVAVSWDDKIIQTSVDETVLFNQLLFDLSWSSLGVEEGPQTLSALAEGDTTSLASNVNLLSPFQSWASYLALQCQDTFLRLSTAEIAEAKATIPPQMADFAQRHPAFSWQLPELCAALDLTATPPQSDLIAQPQVPLLVVNWAFDPLTLPEWSPSALNGFKNVFTYEVPTGGHNLILGPNFCLYEIAADFIENPNQRPDATCLDEEKPRFKVPVSENTFAPTVLVTVADQGIALEVPEAWAEEFAATAKYNDLTRTASLQTTILTATMESEVLPILQDEYWPFVVEIDRRQVGDYTWTMYEGSVGILMAHAAVTQAEDGRFYSIEAVIDSTVIEPKFVIDNLIETALETFQLVEE